MITIAEERRNEMSEQWSDEQAFSIQEKCLQSGYAALRDGKLYCASFWLDTCNRAAVEESRQTGRLFIDSPYWNRWLDLATEIQVATEARVSGMVEAARRRIEAGMPRIGG